MYSLNILYKALIQPIFDYCGVTWYGRFLCDVEKLDKTHKRLLIPFSKMPNSSNSRVVHTGTSSTRSAAKSGRRRDHHGNSFLNTLLPTIPQMLSHIPGPRTFFHLRYVVVVSLLAVFVWAFWNLLSDVSYHHHRQVRHCDDVPTIDKYIEGMYTVYIEGMQHKCRLKN